MMRSKALALMVCISSLLCILEINTVQASNFKNRLNFGSIMVITETTHQEVYDLSMKNSEVKALDISVDYPLQSDTGSVLPAERVQVIINGKSHKLSMSPLMINPDQSKVSDGLLYYPLDFALTLLPTDPPGVYTAKVKIYPIKEHGKVEEAQITEVTITCEIEKWFMLDAPNCMLTLKSPVAPGSNIIANQQPYYLQLAANAPWKLYVSLGTRNAQINRIKDLLKLRLSPGDTRVYHGVFTDGVRLSTEPVLLAQGLSTVDGNQYWIKLPLFLEVENYTLVPAGRYEIPLCFVVLESKP